MVDLSVLLTKISRALHKTGWLTEITDNRPDLKQLTCNKLSGPLGVFTRLDVLMISPTDPANSPGVCLCFFFYADPSKVTDMFRVGRTIRTENSSLFRSQCDSILNAAQIITGDSAAKVTARPQDIEISFAGESPVVPAFMVELDFWLTNEDCLSGNAGTTCFKCSESDNNAETRIEAIYALRGGAHEDVEPLLLDAISDHNPLIRKAALTVLLDYANISYEPLIHDALRDEDESVQNLANEYFRAYRKVVQNGVTIRARQSVEDCLKGLSVPNNREKSIDDLKGVTDSRIIQPLLNIVKDASNSIFLRTSALDVLAPFEDSDFLDQIYSLLRDKDIGSFAAYHLGYKAVPYAQQLLRKALFSNDPAASLSAAHRVVFDDQVIEFFCRKIDEDNPEFRTVAVDRLYSLIICDPQYPFSTSSDDYKLFEKLKQVVLSAMKNVVYDTSEDVCGKAIEVVCSLDKSTGSEIVKAALENFIRCALDEDHASDINWGWGYYNDYQSRLFSAIAALNDTVFCNLLMRLFDSKCWYIRLETANLLLQLGDDRAIGQLEKLLEHPDWNARARAANALFQSGDSQMWEVLVELLNEENDDPYFTKWSMINLLADSKDQRAVETLCGLLNSPLNLRDEDVGEIIKCLAKLGDSSAISSIRKWQYKELMNCDDNLVENALNSLKCRLSAQRNPDSAGDPPDGM